MSLPTQITITPDKALAYPDSSPHLAGKRQQIGSAATPGSSGFFGPDGFSFKDILDTINPLQHIPVVSSLYESATGDVASPAAKLVGGALVGGPIGFVAGLFDVIFEQQTGHSVGGAVLASLTGDDSSATTQVASAAASDDTQPVQTADASADFSTAASIATSTPASEQDRALLALFGNDAKSAHASYRKAQFLPYLKDVNASATL